MRHSSGHHRSTSDSKTPQRGDWRVIRDLLPYLLEYRFRVVLALSCLIAAKFANLGIPILMKDLIDSLDIKASSPQALLVVPVGIIIGYGL
jgi:ATP-binding cassette subfamily B protein